MNLELLNLTNIISCNIIVFVEYVKPKKKKYFHVV